MYAKLFASILDSSVWLESTSTRIVWLTLLAAKDKDGFARFASVENLARRAVVSVKEVETAIKCLESPDSRSSNPDHEGRRIERAPGGWMVLNAKLYDDMVRQEDERRATRDRVRKHREKHHIKVPSVDAQDLSSTHADKFERTEHRTAYFEARFAARNPQAFDANLSTLHEPIAGGTAYSWATIGQAILEVAANGNDPSANAIRAFCRKLAEPAKSSRKGGATGDGIDWTQSIAETK